jgi:hypothetical protein
VVEPRSRLGRLYSYSKDSAFTAQENFTTEALGIAIAEDPEPMIEALYRLDPVRAAGLSLRTSICRPSTQMALPGGGWLDLVLEIFDDDHRVTAEVWVEVKIDAPESGQQLDYYQQRARDHVCPVWLVTLARSPLRDAVPNLSWNELYRAARHGQADHRSWVEHGSWRDLGAFLEEQNVAHDALGPISDREAGSLEPAYELIQKVSALITAVHKKLPDMFPDGVTAKLCWKNPGQLLNYIGLNFRVNGEIIGEGGEGVLTYGLMAQDGTAYWRIVVGAGRATHRTVELARTKVDHAEPSFGVDWDRPQSGSSILVALRRATTLETHESTLGWFEARLREVAASGVLDTLLVGVPIALE